MYSQYNLLQPQTHTIYPAFVSCSIVIVLSNTCMVPLEVGMGWFESSCIFTASGIMYKCPKWQHMCPPAVRSRVIILRLTCTAKSKLLALVTEVCDTVSRNSALVKYLLGYYIIITLVQSYAGEYHEFVAVCIVTSAQHE